jgi:predicted transcriptional regulator
MNTPRWSFRLDPDTRKLLDLLAAHERRSRASVIKILIQDAAKQLPAASQLQAKPPRAKRAKQPAAPTHAN